MHDRTNGTDRINVQDFLNEHQFSLFQWLIFSDWAPGWSQ
jgi:hypothetical protein